MLQVAGGLWAILQAEQRSRRMRACFFFSCCCRMVSRKLQQPEGMEATAFLVLRLVWVAGWLWTRQADCCLGFVFVWGLLAAYRL